MVFIFSFHHGILLIWGTECVNTAPIICLLLPPEGLCVRGICESAKTRHVCVRPCSECERVKARNLFCGTSVSEGTEQPVTRQKETCGATEEQSEERKHKGNTSGLAAVIHELNSDCFYLHKRPQILQKQNGVCVCVCVKMFDRSEFRH